LDFSGERQLCCQRAGDLSMHLTVPKGNGDRAWLALRRALWPDVSEVEQLSEMAVP